MSKIIAASSLAIFVILAGVATARLKARYTSQKIDGFPPIDEYLRQLSGKSSAEVIISCDKSQAEIKQSDIIDSD